MMEMAVPGRRKRGRPRRGWMNLARESMERLGAWKERKSTRRSGKYFRALVTPNREKPKEEKDQFFLAAEFGLENFDETSC